MADAVYASKEIKLQDGTQVTLRPLPIGRLRKFMAEWSKFEHVEEEDEVLDIYINCCGVALQRELADKFENTIDSDGLTTEYKEYLEDVLDLSTIYEVLDLCGGLKLNDPKFLEAAAQAAEVAGKS